MSTSTSDYTIFKKKVENRPIDTRNLEKIKKSIKIRNLLHLRPILVDKDMFVIDGQHRLEAAKHLDIPIFYEISADLREEDVIILNNNQKNWNIENYLHYWITKGNENYIILKNFSDRNNITLSVVLAIIGRRGGGTLASLRNGTLKINKDLGEYQLIFSYLKKAQEFIEAKNILKPSQVKGPVFLRGLTTIFILPQIDKNLFLKKIEAHVDMIYGCISIPNYQKMWIRIYNYKNPNPINISLFDFQSPSNPWRISKDDRQLQIDSWVAI